MNVQELSLLVLTICSTSVITFADDIDENDLDKRAPGWGKRNAETADRLGYLQTVLSDLSKYEMNNEDSDLELNKRRPGWGKRNYVTSYNVDKRRPGWGKRAFEDDEVGSMEEKRAPGWGKRSYGITTAETDSEMAKRRPGWGKRNSYDLDMNKRRPGWGKRAPGWGKRSEFSRCQSLIDDIRVTRLRLYQVSKLRCL